MLLLSEADKGGMFIVSTDANAENVIYYDYFHGNSIATVKNGEYLKLSSCYAKKFSSVKSLNTSGEGMFKVGTHIPAGEYKLTTTEDDIGGMYTVSGDSRKEEVIAWDYFKGSAYVQVKNGQYLILNGCKIIE